MSKDDSPLTVRERLKYFLAGHWGGVFCFVAPLVVLPIILPMATTPKYCWVAYTLCVMALYWVTECIPLAVTSFLPMFLFPLTDVMSSELTAGAYMNNTTIMFIGSLMLATSIEQSRLHIRLAYKTITLIGYSHYKLLLAMSAVTMFMSMWLTNTAATVMVCPIILAVLKVFEQHGLLKILIENESGDVIASEIATCYFCSATYSATIGGIGTLVGTGTNLAAVGLFERAFPKAPNYLSFAVFSCCTIPGMLLMQASCYFSMILVFFGFLRPKSKQAASVKMTPEGKQAAKDEVQRGRAALGNVTFWEIMVIILFGGGILMFFLRSPKVIEGFGDKLTKYYKFKNKKFIADAPVAMFVVFLMILLPQNLNFFKNFKAKYADELPKGKIEGVVMWPKMNANMPYAFTFLLGGGFALSTAADKTGLNAKIGKALSSVCEKLPNTLVILFIIIFTVFLTNFASNVAICNVITPVVCALGRQMRRNPIKYALASCLAASFCFMLPVGTPGNLVVQGYAKVSTVAMIRAGALTTIFIILITWGVIELWSPIFLDVRDEAALPWLDAQ